MRKFLRKNLLKLLPEIKEIKLQDPSYIINSSIDKTVKLYTPYCIENTAIGAYSYISDNCNIKNTTIGKFCSIGPNIMCGRGIHPTNGISTSPMFYSTMKQNGITLSKTSKIDELPEIKIGNDVFIGMNVSILDGIEIGDGAVIGAGAVVSKNIPPYAIAIGVPIQIKSFRFSDEIIEKLLKIKWWDFPEDMLQKVEEYFFDVEKFVEDFHQKE
jgi:acetyltransferase-like isoleucine patch superfamily enzyme